MDIFVTDRAAEFIRAWDLVYLHESEALGQSLGRQMAGIDVGPQAGDSQSMMEESQ